MHRVYNFSAGPAGLPTEILEKAQSELLNWQGLGASVMEVSHRGKAFMALSDKIHADLRSLLNVPKDYHVLLLQGGARLQFSMIPVNLLANRKPGANLKATYAVTGHWSHLAAEEAAAFCGVEIVGDHSKTKRTSLADQSDWKISKDSAYFYYCDNETISGLEFDGIPDSNGLPIVCDMSSNLLSRTIDISRYALVYACAQKNFGIAGVTVVIVHKDFVGNVLPGTPSMLNYALELASDSMLNTPTTFAWYLMGLILDWVKAQGGVAALEKCNQRKAEKLYAYIDGSHFYKNPIDPKYRSRMNVSFYLPDDSMNEAFLKKAEAANLMGLKGHREIGGMRASIYNSMSEAGVDALIAFMEDFRTHYNL